MMVKDKYFKKKKTLKIDGKLFEIDKPLIMGIVNLTPDSFYSESRFSNQESVIIAIDEMLKNGVDIIDIGAVSTRPGAIQVTEKEEISRLLPILKIIRKTFPKIIISQDTYRANVAKLCVNDFNVNIINDISAGSYDSKMFETIKELDVPYIIMHIKGYPENMQKSPEYEDVTFEIIKYFSEKIATLKLLGVNDVIIDVGFGFGKSLEHNYQLLNDLGKFKIFGLPILAGISRKSMINKVLNVSPKDALNGTTVLNTIALLNGADILRVHDVKEAVECRKIVDFYLYKDSDRNL
ncbi:MAG: dihydropteroate synthase [Bacteroidetes bacterium GWA2_30_7]|nr:MAG: dihydropteroate synthase [Bacteroidetes bacterium GWA2_30_7]